MQVDDHTTASLAAPSVDDHGDARTTDEIEDDAAPSIETDAATKHTDNVDAAAGNGNHADTPAQEEEASPSSSIIPGADGDVVAAGELIEAPAPAGVAEDLEEGASPMIATDGAFDEVSAVEAVLGYTFADKSLLEAALTHASFRGAGETYERLEFLGDRAISAAVARHLYHAHPGLRPGPLSRLHDVNVGTEKLARAAVARGLHWFLRHEMPFFAQRVVEFAEEAASYPVHSNGQVTAPKQLADLVESLMGAVFLDSGSDHERLWQAFLRLAGPLIGPEMLPWLKNPMRELDELCQGMGLSAPTIEKKDWAWSHTVKVVVEGETVGSATYSKNHVVARNRAAVAALDTIKANKASALLKGEEAAAGASPVLQDKEAIAGLQVPSMLGKRHGCCCEDVAASKSNKSFKLVATVPSESMAESEHSKIDREASPSMNIVL